MAFIDHALIEQYSAAGWWGTESLSDMLTHHARIRASEIAYVTPEDRTTWSDYDALALQIAQALAEVGLSVGEKVAVFLPDGLHVHASLVATTRAGLVAVGIGARAGDAEIEHLIRRTGSRTLVTLGRHFGRDTSEIVATLQRRDVALDFHVILSGTGEINVVELPSRTARRMSPMTDESRLTGRELGPNELFMLNSTSGTTGLPKCVTQFENRWIHFTHLAMAAGELGPDDVLFGAVPAPFGFGLWTSHFAPLVLGARTVVMPKFDIDQMVDMMEQEHVSVLCCVSTQFRMLLNSPALDTADLSHLRVMFTGGEAIPLDRAREFEERTGASLLQFFGSNETGALSYTTVKDSQEKRFSTAGRVIPHMDVRIFDEQGHDITGPGAVGQPAGKGPLTCRGYFDDPEANRQLFTSDGWMLMGDLVGMDEDGYLTLVGRKSDIIIRGGKNISAAEVEAELETHPAIDLVAVVPVPDDTFGERACAVVSLRTGATLTLDQVRQHLRQRGVSKELCPEHLLVVDDMPRSSGGKLAKGEVRKLARQSLSAPS